jgi:hypothetical protein
MASAQQVLCHAGTHPAETEKSDFHAVDLLRDNGIMIVEMRRLCGERNVSRRMGECS